MRRHQAPKLPSLCKSCGGEIIWCETRNGTPMPVDREPSDEGNILLTPRPGKATLAEVKHRVPGQGRLPIYDTDELRPRYVSHFVTCPHAERHRNQPPLDTGELR